MAQGSIGRQPELHIVRRYPASCDKVWRAWTEPQALSRWFGPGEVDSVTHAALDVRQGGRYRICFRTPDGEEHCVSGVYRVVDPQRELSFSWAWQSTPDRLSLVTVTLRPVDGGTELDFRQSQFFDEKAQHDHARGWA
ncbi:MAG: SRPBCC domain-containing protein, partial [Comamonadaceae bacterium]